MKKVEVFEAFDGQRFDSEDAAISHEKEELELKFECAACDGIGLSLTKTNLSTLRTKNLMVQTIIVIFNILVGTRKKLAIFAMEEEN
jgi:hypothetical protein